MSATTTLAELARQIDDVDAIGSSVVQTFARMIDASGPLNTHLQFTPEPRRYDRAEPIDMKSLVHGDFLTVLYDSHRAKLVLTEHTDRDAMAEHIIDFALLGCEVYAFEHCRRLRYRIEYDDANGPRRHFHPNKPTPGLVWIGTQLCDATEDGRSVFSSACKSFARPR